MKSFKYKFYLFLLICILDIPINAFGQLDTTQIDSNTQSKSDIPLWHQDHDRFRLSQIRIFSPFNQNTHYISDSNFNAIHWQYDDARRTNGVGNLGAGYVGSEVFETLYNPNEEIGFDVGHHAYNPYKFHLDSIQFYDSKKPFTELFYGQGIDQEQSQSEANFGARFTDQLLSIRYKRLNNVGSFDNQGALNTHLQVAYHLQKEKFDLTIGYQSNVNVDINNGGITSDTLFQEPQGQNDISLNAETRLNGVETRHDDKSYVLKFGLDISKLWIFDRLSYHSSFSDKYIKVFDTDPEFQFYGGYYIDDRGLRQYIQWNHWKNNIRLKKNISDIAAYYIGIQANHVTLEQEPNEERFRELYAEAGLQFSFSKRVKLKADGIVGTQNNLLEWAIKSQLDIDFNFIQLAAWLNSSSTLPDLIEHRMFQRDKVIYDNGQSPIFLNNLGGRISIPKYNVFAAMNVMNYIDYRYFTIGSLIPQVANTTLLQVSIGQQKEWQKIGIRNRIDWQARDQNIIPVPNLQGLHQVYFIQPFIRNTVEVKVGLEGRYYLGYETPQFNPMYGAFFAGTNTSFARKFFLVDAFLNARVQSFQFTLRVENLPDLLSREVDYFYSHFQMPYSQPGIRFLFRWRLGG